MLRNANQILKQKIYYVVSVLWIFKSFCETAIFYPFLSLGTDNPDLQA